jgi:hypothetical protein
VVCGLCGVRAACCVLCFCSGRWRCACDVVALLLFLFPPVLSVLRREAGGGPVQGMLTAHKNCGTGVNAVPLGTAKNNSALPAGHVSCFNLHAMPSAELN